MCGERKDGGDVYVNFVISSLFFHKLITILKNKVHYLKK